jgi:protein-S-isoprenylcysteine O-methyltransferase Ste14
MEKQKSFVANGGWWVVAQVPLIVLGVFVPDLDGVQDDAVGLPLRMLGWGVVAIAIVLFVGSVGPLVFRRALTPLPRPAPRASLVTSGLYRLMRHPLYVSMIVGMLGWSLVQLSVAGLIYTVVVAVFFDRKAEGEERMLAERYPEYARYAQRVRRFIPGVY